MSYLLLAIVTTLVLPILQYIMEHYDAFNIVFLEVSFLIFLVMTPLILLYSLIKSVIVRAYRELPLKFIAALVFISIPETGPAIHHQIDVLRLAVNRDHYKGLVKNGVFVFRWGEGGGLFNSVFYRLIYINPTRHGLVSAKSLSEDVGEECKSFLKELDDEFYVLGEYC